ncbi:MAG: ATP-binding cassette domain-containing protein [Candidatus Portnoybacteria bacterium]|nr:ATP-binding cassette domain-containing protein [Candidatus Portnoybacteria bacterium]
MSAIEVKHLSRIYEIYRKEPGLLGSLKSFFYRRIEEVPAVSDISFSVDEGELVGFLGPNGAGKTTTLKMLSGILQPSQGSMRVLGFNPSLREIEYCLQFAIVMGQKSLLLPDLPAWESFVLHKYIYEISEAIFNESIGELIDALGIREILDVPVRKISLGQRMKCELASALMHRPKVLFLDEPTIGLDVVAQKQIRDFLKRHNREKKTTILLTSHYMEDIKELCERVIIINHGNLVYDGGFNSLIVKYAPYKILHITFNESGVRLEDVNVYGHIEKFHPFECEIRVDRENAKHIAAQILASNLPVDDILIDEIAADDVIRSIFKEV